MVLHDGETGRNLGQSACELVAHLIVKTSGPSCSKLTTSLVNVWLKFQTLISHICQYFLSKKFEKLLQCKRLSHFSTENITVFLYKVVKHLTR